MSYHVDTTKRQYILGFTVHEARDLSPDGSAIDPLIVVRALGREWKTQMKYGKALYVKFAESYIWNDIKLTDDEFNMASIEFELQAAHVFARNAVMGSGKVQLTMVYKRPGHAYNNKMVQLSSGHRLAARVKVSVFCYSEGDDPPRPEHEDEVEDAERLMEDLGAAVMGFSNDDEFKQAYHLFVHMHFADSLGGGKGRFNPYITCDFNGVHLETPPSMDTRDIHCDECFRLPVVTPLFADSIVIRAWNKATWGSDQIIVQGRLSFSLLRMHAMSPKWFNFYGFDKKEVGDASAIHDVGECAQANAYMGRMLLSGRVQKIASVEDLLRPDLVKAPLAEEPPTSVQCFAIEVLEVSGCPGASCYVVCRLGVLKRTTKTAKRSRDSDPDVREPGRFPFKGERGRMKTLKASIPTEESNALDVFVNVYSSAGGLLGDEFKRVGFARLKVIDIKTIEGCETASPMWITCNPMAHLPNNIDPGAVLVSVKRSASLPEARMPAIVKPLPFELRAYVLMARDLNSGKGKEDNSLPNPVVQVSCAGKSVCTSIARSTVVPSWKECLRMRLQLQCSVSDMKVQPEPVRIVAYNDEGTDMVEQAKATAAAESAKAKRDTKSKAGKAKQDARALEDAESPKRKSLMDKSPKEAGAKLEDAESPGGVKSLQDQGADGAEEKTETQALALKDAEGQNDSTSLMDKSPKAAKEKKEKKSPKAGGDGVIAQRVDHWGKSYNPFSLMGGYGMMRTSNLDHRDRRVIGRAQVVLQKCSRPGEKRRGMKMKWLKLKGGLLGAQHNGDILVAFELVREKYKDQIPVRSTTPAVRDCSISLSLLGIRNLTLDLQQWNLGKPKIMVLGPDIGDTPASCVISWTRRPPNPYAMGDYNKKWTKSGRSGFEFFKVMHIPARLPKACVMDPNIRFLLFAENADPAIDSPVAEGRFSLIEDMPWGKPEKAKKTLEALDAYVDSDVSDAQDGIAITDIEDGAEGETKQTYTTIKIDEGLISISFDPDDDTSFPPVVLDVTPDSVAGKHDIEPGMWLVGYQGAEDDGMRLTGVWTPAQAAAWVAAMDEQQVRPLTLKFRRKSCLENCVWVPPELEKLGLQMVQDKTVTPPRIAADLSEDRRWRKAGVSNGNFIVDINGVDLTDMSILDPKVRQLLGMRPSVITFRPFGKEGEEAQALAQRMNEEKSFMLQQPVMLNGLPSALVLETEVKMDHKDGDLLGTRVPRPCAALPPVNHPQALNLRLARSGLMDVRGIVKNRMKGDDGDEDDFAGRPSLLGRMEDIMEGRTFRTVDLLQAGEHVVGQIKFAFKIKYPADLEWADKIEDQNTSDFWLFQENSLRRKYKKEQPFQLRVRAYIIRGLNISGAASGPANPYLFFRFGASTVRLEGHKQLLAVEPRYYKTEEKDVRFPEEALMEVGLHHWEAGTGADDLIGSSFIDLEDRWYAESFQASMRAKNVPIEYRPIMNGELSRGSLEMWVELIDSEMSSDVPTSVLFQPLPVEVEIRVIVYEVTDVSRQRCVDDLGAERESIDCAMRCYIDCKSYAGAHPKEQETDIHRSCVSDAEYNWRFVFPKVQVQQGENLDCFVQFAMMEHLGMQRPTMMCECFIDMKTYCKKVAQHRKMIQVESKVPLHDARDGDEDHSEGEGGSDDDDDEEAGGNAKKGRRADALARIMVQVLMQGEATQVAQKAGLGRDDPNQAPALSFPKSGRSWQATLPGVAATIQDIKDVSSSIKNNMCCALVCFLLIVVPTALSFVENPSTHCSYNGLLCSPKPAVAATAAGAAGAAGAR